MIIADGTVLVSEDAGHHPHTLPDVEDTSDTDIKAQSTTEHG